MDISVSPILVDLAMAALPKDVERKSSNYSDEKVSSEQHPSEKVEVAEELTGEVYDDVRAIDLDEDGKERPIGRRHSTSSKERSLLNESQ